MKEKLYQWDETIQDQQQEIEEIEAELQDDCLADLAEEQDDHIQKV